MPSRHSLSRQLAKALEEQGCTIIETRKGYRALHPNGKDSVGWHHSLNPNAHSLKNLRAQVARIGLIFPKDIH